MSPQAALARIVASLDAAGIPHMVAGSWKIDLILRKDRPFSRAEFERRIPAQILGAHVFVATAEDTILATLEWAQLGESDRQLRDVVGVIELCGDALDRAYIERWTRELGVEGLWERVSR